MTSSHAPAEPPAASAGSRNTPAPKPAAAGELLGDGSRFSVQRVLGHGASGTVYQAYDSVRGAVVAVKSLSHIEPAALFRFKAEFRTLVGLSHPNLLALHELLSSAEHWLLSMELVQGGDFLSYVRPESGAARSRGEDLAATENPSLGDSDATEDFGLVERRFEALAALAERPRAPVHARPARGAIDEPRLRESLRQLCEGLHALHRTGRLHRDLKPANVLVFDATGRVVICDFGLALETGAPGRNQRGPYAALGSMASSSTADGGGIAGTLAYMSPEQAMGLTINEASDWYAVGVMLYQALTGVLPVSGELSLREAIAAKLLRTPVHPTLIDPLAPQTLADLALALLGPVPTFRPGYRDMLQHLLVAGASPAAATHPRSYRPAATFGLTGREPQLDALGDALRRVRGSGAKLVFVAGQSGMGKSALVNAFLDVARDETCLILCGRCYEREHLPYKAFDPLLDALSSYLLGLDAEIVRDLLPQGTAALRRLFPVLDRVQAVREFETHSVSDTLDVRSEAFSALRELCRRLSRSKPLVLYIDDLQWGDLDSAALFLELLRQPEAPSVLLLCAYRSEEQEQSPLLRLFAGEYLRDGGAASPELIEVNPLDETESRALALSLIGDVADAPTIATKIAEEARGSPLFVGELAAIFRAPGGQATAGLELAGVIHARLAGLPEPQRRLLSLIAVAGRPEPLAIIFRNAGLGGSALGVLSALEAQRLVRSTGPSETDRVEVYHDQIREAAYRMLTEEQRQEGHRCLAEAVENGSGEPETLYRHWHAAGDLARAGDYAVMAASSAEGSLAYDRAAELYEAALDLLDVSDPRRRELREQLGNALMGAGHGARAARVFFDALDGAPPARAAQLRQLGITQLMCAGQLDAAFLELTKAEHLIGVRTPQTTGQALWMVLWRKALLFWGGKRLRVRSPGSAEPALEARMTMLWAIGAALMSVDPVRASVYHLELVRLARKTGEPYHLACALSLSSVMLAAKGTDPAHVDWLSDRALELAAISGRPHALSVVMGCAGVSRLVQGRFLESVRLLETGTQLLQRQRSATLAWDRVANVFYELVSQALIGNVNCIILRVPEAARAADARGDRLASTLFRSFRCCWAYLGVDDPEQAQLQAERAEHLWQESGYGYSLQHCYITYALAETALYSRAGVEAAFERVEREWRAGLFVRQVHSMRIELLWLRGRLALAVAERTERAELYELARKCSRAIEREGVTWALPYSRLLDAALCYKAETARALILLQQAASLAEAVDMRLLSAVACSLVAQLEGTREAEARLAAAHADLRRCGAKCPEGFVRMLAPGFPNA